MKTNAEMVQFNVKTLAFYSMCEQMLTDGYGMDAKEVVNDFNNEHDAVELANLTASIVSFAVRFEQRIETDNTAVRMFIYDKFGTGDIEEAIKQYWSE